MSEPATSFRPDILPAAQRRMWDARIGVPGYFVLYGGTALSPLPISRRARMEGRRSANVIAQGQRAQPREGLSGPFYAGTSAALGHAVAMGKPCKGAIELDARGGFALAGLYGSPAGTQGCAPTSLTLGYYIAGLSALSLEQLSTILLRLVGNAQTALALRLGRLVRAVQSVQEIPTLERGTGKIGES